PVPPFGTPSPPPTTSCEARFARSPSPSAKEKETPPNAPLERSSRSEAGQKETLCYLLT
ncbi:hypothetical protein LEMLEM_LOCUS6802, partial [Lemmus lemmus]